MLELQSEDREQENETDIEERHGVTEAIAFINRKKEQHKWIEAGGSERIPNEIPNEYPFIEGRMLKDFHEVLQLLHMPRKVKREARTEKNATK